MRMRLKPFAVILLSTLFLLGCGRDENVKKPGDCLVKATRVKAVSRGLMKSFPGKAAAAHKANLSFRVPGTVIEFPVEVGDKVPKGGLLARLDPRDFEVRLKNAKGQLERSLAALKLAEAEYERVRRIRRQDRGAVSETMLDQRRQAFYQIKAGIQSLEASVDAAKDALGYTELKAPFDGMVVATFVENFEDVPPKMPVVRLVDITEVEFKVDIPEDCIVEAAKVKEVLIRFDIRPGREIPARLKKFGREASQITRTYPVTFVASQPDDFKILPGMAGTARFPNGRPRENAAVFPEIPLSALHKGAKGKDDVWVVDEKSLTITRRRVKIGALTGNGVTVIEGLKSGELIVSAGVDSLKDGQTVRILQTPTFAVD